MLKDKITVMVLPRDRGEVKQFAIPVKLLWAVGIFSICFVLVNIFLLADYFDKRVDQARMAKLIEENALLAQQFTAMKESIDFIKDDYASVVAKEEAIRTIFDLPSIDPESRMLGVGGPREYETDVTPHTMQALEVTADVDELLRLSKFERERYQEVFELLRDKRDIMDHTPSILPTKGYFSCGFGYRDDPFTGFKQFHSGLDIANKKGTPIYAPADGRVVSTRVNGGLGKMIVLDHGFGYKTRYGHLDSYNVKIGQKVKRGEMIGTMGSTGYSTGPHLHYEVLKNNKAVNPYKFIINNK